MAIITITGDIGAGKSTVSDLFAKFTGYEKFNADEIAKGLWNSDEVKNLIVSRWGDNALDENNNVRLKMIAEIIFNSPSEYEYSCKIIHPRVMSKLFELTNNNNAVIEVPLLFEAGRPEWVKLVIFVTAEYKIRLARVKNRGWNENELLRREKFLLPQKKRMAMSDIIIMNNSDLEDLEARVKEIINAL